MPVDKVGIRRSSADQEQRLSPVALGQVAVAAVVVVVARLTTGRDAHAGTGLMLLAVAVPCDLVVATVDFEETFASQTHLPS